MHRLALLIRYVSKSRVLGHLFYKNVLSRAMLPMKARIRVCQRIDIKKTPPRLLTGHGKSSKANVCGLFFKKKIWLAKMLILPSDFKTISFEEFILWEIAARKLDSSPVGIESPCC